MRLFLFLIPLILFFTVVNAQNTSEQQSRPKQWAQPISIKHLKNAYEVDKGVYCSAQPNYKSFIEIEKYGIKEVLNLRKWHTDSKKAKETNLILHQVKMDAHNINDNDIIETLKIIKNRKGNILIHCKHGSDRTGIVCALYRIIFQNWSKQDAINEMQNGGYGFHSIYANIPNYIKNVDIENLKKQINK